MAAKDDFDLFSQVSEMLGLEAEEAENFITSAMRRRGHRPTINWADNEEEGDKSGGDFFSKKRETRRVGNRSPNRGREASGGGWQYG